MLKINTDGTFVGLHSRHRKSSFKIEKIVSKNEELLWNEKRYIRQMDKAFFTRACGIQYMENKEIDHDWENGCTCRVVSHSEHVKLGVARGEFENRLRVERSS